MKVVYNTKAFMKEMNNLLEYSTGFIQGVELGKNDFLSALGATTVEVLKQYIDSNARANPEVLHHIYEWYEVGSPPTPRFAVTRTLWAKDIPDGARGVVIAGLHAAWV
jgi:hypothetical protein